MGKAVKITDVWREKRYGIIVKDIEELRRKSQEKFDLNPSVNRTLKIVLETDGTVIEDNDYFDTIPSHTCLMILDLNQNWCPNAPKCRLNIDQIDSKTNLGDSLIKIVEILERIRYDLTLIPTLNDSDLELLKTLDSNSVQMHGNEYILDKILLKEIQKAVNQIIVERKNVRRTEELIQQHFVDVDSNTYSELRN